MRMKKLLSILLVTAMLASMAVTAFANEGETKPETPAENPSVEDEVTPEETGKTEETAKVETLTPAEPVVPPTAPTEPSEGTEATAGTITFRGQGPGLGNAQYDYAATYAAAGISCSNNTITINKDTFEAFFADEKNADAVKVMRQQEKDNMPLCVGVLLSKPDSGEYTHAKVMLGETILLDKDLTDNDEPSGNGTDMFHGEVIQYITFADADGTLRDARTIELTATWTKKEAGQQPQVKVAETVDVVYNINVEVTSEEEPPVTPPDQGGNDNNGSSNSGSSSSNEDNTPANAPSANVGSNGAVSAAKISGDAKKAVSNAKNGKANVNVTNAKTVGTAALNNMAKAAAKEDVALTMTAKTTDKNGVVVASLKFDATKAAEAVAKAGTKEVKLGVELNTKNTKNVTSLFKKWFKNKNITVVKMAQKGEFGFTVEAAVKVDLKNFNKNNLKFYSYNAATNTYKEIETKYTIDAKGLVHFNTTVGNYIIITDAPIASKQ